LFSQERLSKCIKIYSITIVGTLLFDVALDLLGLEHVSDEPHHPLGQLVHDTCVARVAQIKGAGVSLGKGVGRPCGAHYVLEGLLEKQFQRNIFKTITQLEPLPTFVNASTSTGVDSSCG